MSPFTIWRGSRGKPQMSTPVTQTWQEVNCNRAEVAELKEIRRGRQTQRKQRNVVAVRRKKEEKKKWVSVGETR